MGHSNSSRNNRAKAKAKRPGKTSHFPIESQHVSGAANVSLKEKVMNNLSLTPPEVQIINVCSIFTMALGLLQLLYFILVDRTPSIQFSASIGALLSFFAMANSLHGRILESHNKTTKSDTSAYIEFVAGTLILAALSACALKSQ